MPYKLYKVVGGYKVGKADGTKMSNGRMYLSNKPKTKEAAKKQMIDVDSNEPKMVKKKKPKKKYK